MSEHTNPGIVGSPARSPFQVDWRAFAMGALFLMGGAGAGGGASIIGDNGLREEVKELVDQVRALTRSVDALASDAKATEREHETMRTGHDDHETRIRTLENRRRP